LRYGCQFFSRYLSGDEWNVWYRTHPKYGTLPANNKLEEIYNLEDALVTAMHFNTFIRHAHSVRMASMAQLVNVIAPIFTRQDGLVLQTIFYPFELYSRTCGKYALDVWWKGDTFDGGEYTGVRTLDVSATLDEARKQLVLYVINRSRTKEMETMIKLTTGSFSGQVKAYVINGPDIKSENTFEAPGEVATRENTLISQGQTLTCMFESYSITALACEIS
jgi:alpha-N-arabinofuranosidase